MKKGEPEREGETENLRKTIKMMKEEDEEGCEEGKKREDKLREGQERTKKEEDA